MMIAPAPQDSAAYTLLKRTIRRSNANINSKRSKST